MNLPTIDPRLVALGIKTRAMLIEELEALGLSPSTAQNYAAQYLADNSKHKKHVEAIVRRNSTRLARIVYLASDTHQERLNRLRNLDVLTDRNLIDAISYAGHADVAETYTHMFLRDGVTSTSLWKIIEDAAVKWHARPSKPAKEETVQPASPQRVINNGRLATAAPR